MHHKIFGTDGIRGKVGDFPMTPDTIVKIGFIVGEIMTQQALKNLQGKAKVIIGKDPRLSGYMLESALEAGFAAAGVDILLTGPLPTPGIAYLTRALRLQAGLMISASHNSYLDNGIKFFDAQGLKLPDSLERHIESKMDEPIRVVNTEQVGRAKRIDDAEGRYIEFCKSRFPAHLNLRGLTIVADTANGAGYKTLQSVLHELGAKVHCIGNQPNGININENVGTIHPETLRTAVLEYQADIGIAIDGDGDRVCLCDQQGHLYDGDDILFILSATINQINNINTGATQNTKNHTSTSGIVGTVMTNMGLEHYFQQQHIPFQRVSVGDRHILERLLENGWKLGGETSGHILLLNHHCAGDGTLSALQVLARMVDEEKNLKTLAQGWQRVPQKLLNVAIPNGFDWQQDSIIQNNRKNIEKKLSHHGRLLLRASGTEPVLRILVESHHEDDLSLADHLAESIRKQCGENP